ncbi:MAG: hypothetical protein DID92_2727744024 [Candidatus Nitrotoga sp. SPKER]|nr:MAG: hypothetical protein DID92_2727744024 [Candidatus Nitrotoga sp. SPKER]
MDTFNNSEFVISVNVQSKSRILAFIVTTAFLEVL